ncbi:MAG: magnesium protoporphyrin IX methyltransferase [Pseudomonadota bacterium]
MHAVDAKYLKTRARVEDYFDRTATRSWAQLTSDAPVSGIRATVRAGRDRMRALILDQLPRDLTGQRILDAGCGTGAMAVELAARGAQVVAIDISPSLIDIAESRCPRELKSRIEFVTGDMFSSRHGLFDHAVAMDSMIYYEAPKIGSILAESASKLRGDLIFTLPPRTSLLMVMWQVGKLFPRSNRSPVMVPHSPSGIAQASRQARAKGAVAELETVNSGFYHSTLYRFSVEGHR